MKAIGQARSASAALAELLPDEAEYISANGDVATVAITDLVVGDRSLVRSDSRVSADGRIIEGSVELDQSMITGDPSAVADHVAERLGIDEAFAEVLPQDEDRRAAELQERADVELAIGAGTDVAIESAGVVLASSDPSNVLGVIELSKASYRKMLQNLAWAGALLMSFSTIVVNANAQLLRRLDLRPAPLISV